jgi:hypothetical protein
MKRVILALACLVAPVLLWAEADDLPPTEWELPTYKGDKPSYQAPAKSAPAGPIPDGRELFQMALDCWPAPSYFRASVSLEGRLRNDRSTTLNSSGQLDAGSRASVSIVANLPLYAPAEMDKEREREYGRRTKAADAVGELIGALADRSRIYRELDLMRSLERRSQERVKIGVAETAEQVKYLEKVADLEGTLIKQRGTIEKARLGLIGMCAAQHADRVDQYIARYIKGR